MSSNPNPGIYERLLAAVRGTVVENFHTIGDANWQFLQFTRTEPLGKVAKGENWKLHVSVHPEDMSTALEAFIPIADKYGIHDFKVADSNLAHKWHSPLAEQAGKQLTIYEEHSGGKFDWKKIVEEVECAFRWFKIRPSVTPIKGDKMIPGSQYIGYRNDSLHGSLKTFLEEGSNAELYKHDWNHADYVSAETSRLLVENNIIPAELAHNPSGIKDPLKHIEIKKVMSYSPRRNPVEIADNLEPLIPETRSSLRNMAKPVEEKAMHFGKVTAIAVGAAIAGYTVYELLKKPQEKSPLPKDWATKSAPQSHRTSQTVR